MRVDRIYLENVIKSYIEASKNEHDLYNRCQMLRTTTEKYKADLMKEKGWINAKVH